MTKKELKSSKLGISKVHVKFSGEQLEIIRSLKGPLGDTDAEVVRSICIAYLSEKGLLDKAMKRRLEQ